MAVVFLLVGMTGAGKTTYCARILEPAGAVRVSADDSPVERVLRELALGHDVALDLGLGARADRDAWKRRITAAGAGWRMLYFPVSHAELLARLAERDRLGGAGAPAVAGADLDDLYARFEAPDDEGEDVVQPGSF